MNFTPFVFKDPWVFAFLLLLPLVAALVLWRKRDRSDFVFPVDGLLEDARPTLRMRLAKSGIVLRLIGVGLIILALARPQSILEGTKTISDGVDIVLTIDTSTSMLAEDFRIGTRRINRFDIVKEVVKDFISKRKDDRIGMVAFAARAYTACPLSTDYEWLFQNLDRISVGMVEDGTAVGSAIMSSVNRLRTSKTKSRVIILLSDGVNNAGNISPLTAAEAAKALKIKVYTIAVGSKGLVPYPFRDQMGRMVYQNIPIEMDEQVLRKIADVTGGKYYLASDTETLRRVYDDINRLERSNIEHFGYREFEELFYQFLVPALILLALEVILSNTVFLKIP